MRRAKSALDGPQKLNEWLYDIEWLPQVESSESAAGRISLSELSTNAQEDLERLGKTLRLDQHHGAILALEALSTSYIIRALRQLGWNPTPGDQANTEGLAHQLGISEFLPSFTRTFFVDPC